MEDYIGIFPKKVWSKILFEVSLRLLAIYEYIDPIRHGYRDRVEIAEIRFPLKWFRWVALTHPWFHQTLYYEPLPAGSLHHPRLTPTIHKLFSEQFRKIRKITNASKEDPYTFEHYRFNMFLVIRRSIGAFWKNPIIVTEHRVVLNLLYIMPLCSRALLMVRLEPILNYWRLECDYPRYSYEIVITPSHDELGLWHLALQIPTEIDWNICRVFRRDFSLQVCGVARRFYSPLPSAPLTPAFRGWMKEFWDALRNDDWSPWWVHLAYAAHPNGRYHHGWSWLLISYSGKRLFRGPRDPQMLTFD